jgi:3'-phosphoadenosine 5'-phosphosulfate sulfotransferase (PAPS reductase)/FAD synthetase
MATMREVMEQLQDNNIRHIVNLSGGKDSTAMAIYMRQRYPQIPVEYVFCDTGCELLETYEYLERLQALLGAEILYLNALDGLGIARKSNRNPFDIWLYEVYGGFLPNPRARWCTRVLKIEPFEHHVGQDRAFSYIGIRADEDRDGYVSRRPPVISQKPNIIPVYPLRDDGIELADITEIIDITGLGLPEYYKWRSRSGCYFCFYQQIGEWQGLKEHHPEKFDEAKEYEKFVKGKRFTWVEGRTLDDIAGLPKRHATQAVDEADGCAICHI